MAIEHTTPVSLARRLGSNQDIALAVCIIGILMVLLVPVPTIVIDLLLTLNISISVVVLLATIYLQRPVEFAVFPSLLLILTIFRLSLNIAVTRMILKEGEAGAVVNTFGNFVTSGNLVVGVIIFAILIIVQFVVITRGAGRISEVAARFTLDAMPGKQMGVDADLNAGLITEAQARQRRHDIEREADFYGAMDGATKFVRGDAIAGLIITIINIIGGLIIGMAMRGDSFADASRVYTQLTIGDGLVSQIPALVISTAAGLIVTRTATEENMGADFAQQLTRYPRALGVASVMLAAFGIVPGMPTAAFLMMSSILGFMAYRSTQVEQARKTAAVEAELAQKAAPQAETTQRTEDLLTVDPLKIELGYGLITLADTKHGGDLLSRIQIIRQQTAAKMGFIVPVIRIVDNMRLRPNEYRVKLREATIGTYELYPDHFMAMNPGLAEEEIDGIPTKEPAFGLQAVWVSREDRDRAERLGYTIVEPSAVMATHLSELIMSHAEELVSREDTQTLIKHIKASDPTLIEDLIPHLMSLGDVQKVLHNLLRERVSIRNLVPILETLADYAHRTKDTDILTEYCRHRLAREITAAYMDEEQILHVVTLDPALEQELHEAIRQSDSNAYVPLEPTRAETISTNTGQAVQSLILVGHEPVVLTSAPVRRYFRRAVERRIPRLIVLSYNEIDPAVQVQSEGQVKA